jgi:TonB family protein
MRGLRVAVAGVLSLALSGWLAPFARAGDSSEERTPLPMEGTITNPDWSEKPTGEQMAAYYPHVAQAVGLSGRATISCEVTEVGQTVNCKVLSEQPLGMGFGGAAVELAQYFRMKPMQVDGTPVGGAHVTIPIKFLMPQPPPLPADAPAQGPAPTPKALELATRIATINLHANDTDTLANEARTFIDREFAGQSLSEQEQAALDSFVAATVALLPQRVAALADRYASRLSETELADIDAFIESPSGKAWLAFGTGDAEGSQADYIRMTQTIMADVRARFCAKYPCLPEDAAPPSATAAAGK